MKQRKDGTPIDMIFNSLSFPSRMNAGQILESLSGVAAEKLGVQVATPVFNGAAEDEIGDLLEAAGLP